MIQASNIESIEKTTGKPWDEWLVQLNDISAQQLTHTEIADRVRPMLSGTIENAGWWAQNITVAYEQHIGRRKPGQRSDGTYYTSVSKTLTGGMDDGMKLWTSRFGNAAEFHGLKVSKSATSTVSASRRHWACGLEDGSRVSVDVMKKSDDKVIMTITHEKLDDQAAIETWKINWKQSLDAL